MIYPLLLTTSAFTFFTTSKAYFQSQYYNPFHVDVRSMPGSEDWSYGEGVKKWSNLYPGCKGSNQSPIRLSQSQAKNISMTWLEWGNMDIVPVAMNLTNNGHTIMLKGLWPASQIPFIYQRHTGHLFELDHVHWHWGRGIRDGTEHKVDGRKATLEMHMVFQRVLGGKEGEGPKTLVAGYLFEHDNMALRIPIGISKVVSHLVSVEEPGEVAWLHPPFKVGELVPQEPTNVFFYTGSLTSPPCTEPVIWLVAAKTSFVRDIEMDEFRFIMNSHGEEMSGNIRPLQPGVPRQHQPINVHPAVSSHVIMFTAGLVLSMTEG